ncbi:hypothetical protein PAV_1c08410 [Paenibacillus alvei DSM 29]|nr:hypothetical protein PAV_1c08410 [Paenibacillus alvei DSM 29]
MIEGIDYIKLDDEDLKKLHEEMLQLLIELDKICQKITYRIFSQEERY